MDQEEEPYLVFVAALHLFWHLSVKFLPRNVIEMEDSHSAFILYLVSVAKQYRYFIFYFILFPVKYRKTKIA